MQNFVFHLDTALASIPSEFTDRDMYCRSPRLSSVRWHAYFLQQWVVETHMTLTQPKNRELLPSVLWAETLPKPRPQVPVRGQACRQVRCGADSPTLCSYHLSIQHVRQPGLSMAHLSPQSSPQAYPTCRFALSLLASPALCLLGPQMPWSPLVTLFLQHSTHLVC